MDIKEFDIELKRLLKDPDVKKAWLDYHSRFNHQRSFFRFARQYENQVPIIDGKRHGKDINLFKLFIEQTLHLLRTSGHCGIVVPSGIYTDLGAKKLREMLFDKTQITSLFGIENRKEVFEGVHRSFKFIVLTFQKGGKTVHFPAAFMRHDVEELYRFPGEGSLPVSIDLVRRLSPESLSVMEFKCEADIRIAETMLRQPLLGEAVNDAWNLELHREFNMTDDAFLFQNKDSRGALPLFEGKMIWQFDHRLTSPRYWIAEREGRAAVIGRNADSRQKLGYQSYRLAYRDVTGSTNERTLIATVLHPGVFTGNTIVNSASPKNPAELLFIAAVMNSFVVDALVRQKVTNHCNMFYIYQLPVPRLTEKDPAFPPIVSRAAKLICTTPEFDELASASRHRLAREGVTDPGGRAQLRAELDGLIAHLYGLTLDEFAYILTTFPLVAQPVKDAALGAFRTFMPKPGDLEIAALLTVGESAKVEFKSSARWDLRENKKNPVMEQVILKTVAAFLNSEGGTLLLGVSDNGTALGLEHDYQTLQKKNADGYELFLSDLLLTHYGKDCSPCVRISFHEFDGKQICRIIAQSAPRPIWVKEEGTDEHLYIRSGNSTRRLNTKEALEYCKTRWKG